MKCYSQMYAIRWNHR